jgi:hypothetical protein
MPTVTPGPTLSPFPSDIQLGIQSLIDHDFEGAKTAFATAIANDASRAEAKVWYSLLDIASISVNSSVVNLFHDSLGLSSYPSTMTELFSESWFNEAYYVPYSGFTVDAEHGSYIRGDLGGTTVTSYYYAYSSHRELNAFNLDFIPSDTGSYYASSWYDSSDASCSANQAAFAAYTHYSEASDIIDGTSIKMMPELSVPAWCANLMGMQAGDPKTIGQYGLILLANVATNNPSGFNSALASVKSVALGTQLSQAIARVESLSDVERVVIPWELFEAYKGPGPSILVDNNRYISLGKAELLLFASQLRMNKAFVQYLSSVDLSYNISDLTTYAGGASNWDIDIDADADLIPDVLEGLMDASDGFFNTSLLTNRSTADRTASKASMLAAIQGIMDAGDLISEQWADSGSYYNDIATTLQMPEDIRSRVGAGILAGVTLAEKFYSGINSNSTVYLPTADLSDGDVLVEGYAWPSAPGDGVTGINPGALWASNALDPRSWIVTNASGFVPYIGVSEISVEPNSYVSGSYAGTVFPYTGQGLSLADYGNPQNVTGVATVRARGGLLAKLTRMQEFVPDLAYGDASLFLPCSPADYTVYSNSGGSTTLTPPAVVFCLIDWLNK